MVDRELRERVAGLIESWLREAEKDEDAAEQLEKLVKETPDEAARYVADIAALEIEFKIGMTKAEWDYLQRLLLLLRSDACVRIERRRWWSGWQPVTAVSFGAYLWVAVEVGWSEKLAAAHVFFGAISMMIGYVQGRPIRAERRRETPRAPFESRSQIRTILKRTGFQKTPYPAKLGRPRAFMLFMRFLQWEQGAVLHLIFVPVMLVAQAWPGSRKSVSVISECS